MGPALSAGQTCCQCLQLAESYKCPALAYDARAICAHALCTQTSAGMQIRMAIGGYVATFFYDVGCCKKAQFADCNDMFLVR